jgi:hypothetical protein
VLGGIKMSDSTTQDIDMAICAKCKHHYNREDGLNTDVWYSWFCTASKRDAMVDPVTGKRGYRAVNLLGNAYAIDNPYHYCRDINPTGECKLFKGKLFKK